MPQITTVHNKPHSAKIQKGHVILLNLWRVVNTKGGTEKVLCEMANALNHLGYDVSIICHDEHTGKPGFHLDENIRFINAYRQPSNFFFNSNIWVKLRTFNFNKSKRRNQRTLAFLQKELNWKLKNLQEAFQKCPNPNIIICFQPEATFIVHELMQCSQPTVTMYHMTPEYFAGGFAFETFFRSSVNHSSAVQVLMPEYVPIAKQLHPDTPVVWIPNTAPKFDVPAELTPKKIINIARIASQKRPELLVQAFALLKDRFPDWTCEWWGETHVDPKLTASVNSLIKTYGLQNRFFLKGSTDDIESKLRSSSIFAFPSSFEGQSLSMLEAMSIGLPLVGCLDCPSVNTTIKNGRNGILTQPTAESYAEGLAKLMVNEELRCRLGAQARIDIETFSPSRVWGTMGYFDPNIHKITTINSLVTFFIDYQSSRI